MTVDASRHRALPHNQMPFGLIVREALAPKCLIRKGLLNRYRSVCTRVPHLEQNTSFAVSALPQLTQA